MAYGFKSGGRQKGTPNKTTALLKDAILQAAREAGGDGDDGLKNYLVIQAKENPAPFMALLGKVLPMQVSGDPENPIRHEHGGTAKLESFLDAIASRASGDTSAE